MEILRNYISPIFPEHKGSRDGGLPARGVVRHGDEQLVVVGVLVSYDDAHRARFLGANHLMMGTIKYFLITKIFFIGNVHVTLETKLQSLL